MCDPDTNSYIFQKAVLATAGLGANSECYSSVHKLINYTHIHTHTHTHTHTYAHTHSHTHTHTHTHIPV